MAKKKSPRSKTPAQMRASEERKWQARSDLQTLRSAEEIRIDRSRLSAAQREAKAELKALQKVTKEKRK